MSSIDLAIDNLKTQVNELKQQFSLARKKGKDVSLPYLKFMNLPSKIGIAEATKNPEDVKKALVILEETKKELEEAQLQQEEQLRHRDEEGYAQRAQSLFAQASRAIKEKNHGKMLESYVQLRGIYPFVPPSLKKEMYKRSLELYTHINQLKRGAA